MGCLSCHGVTSMWRHARFVSCTFSLAAVLLSGCTARPEASGQSPTEQASRAAEDRTNKPSEPRSTTIVIRSRKPSDDSATARPGQVAVYGLTRADYERFLTIGTIVQHVPTRIFPQAIRYLERQQNGRVVATTSAYADINKIKLTSGRFFSDDDDHRMLNVVVIGSGVAERLFPFEDPLSQVVTIGKYDYQVIGVMENRMALAAVDGGSQSGEDFNNDVYIPLQTCLLRFGEKIFIRQSGSRSGEQVELSQITIIVDKPVNVPATVETIRELLERHHPKQDWDVIVK